MVQPSIPASLALRCSSGKSLAHISPMQAELFLKPLVGTIHPFRLRPDGHTSPGHSRDSPTLDRSSSVSKTTTFHFAASLASPRRRSVSLSSSASSEGDIPPTMISFAPSFSAAQKAINTDCRLSGQTSCETRNARSLERGIIVPAGSLASRGRLPKTSLGHLSQLFAGGSRLPRPWEKETTSFAR